MNEDHTKETTYFQFISFVEQFLQKSKSISIDSASSSIKIIENSKEFSDRLSPNSMRNYLSYAAIYDDQSKIKSAGRSKGYYFQKEILDAFDSQSNSSATNAELEGVRQRVFREAAIYPILREWLIVKGYKSKIIANLNGGPAWSNPDVVGLLPTSHIDINDLEIVTIEAKISMSNWQKDIFEAISHKRLSNRVYFAYPTIQQNAKIPIEMRRYCETYRIGLLTIELDKNTMEKILQAKNNSDLPTIENVEFVEESIPAPYDFLPPRFQIDFLRQIGVNQKDELWNFGAN